MAIIRVADIRKMNADDRQKKLNDLSLEIAKERANINIGATVISPGKIKDIRKAIARIKTIQNQPVVPQSKKETGAKK